MENETILDFLKRTDALASKLSVNVQDLSAVIGLSRASLFSYRTGNRPISAKAWTKLETAERAAGILRQTLPRMEQQMESFTLREDAPEDPQPNPHAAELVQIARRLQEIATALSKQTPFFSSTITRNKITSQDE